MKHLRSIIIACLCAAPVFAGPPDTPVRTYSPSMIKQDLFGPHSAVTNIQEESVLQDRAGGKKSVALAALYSLLLPGMGELYAGGFASGKYFLAGEAVLWLTYAAFDIYGNAVRDDARAYAVAYAGVNPSGKDDQYYINIGNFRSMADYNDKKLRDRFLDAVYAPNTGYDWQWQSDAARAFYRDRRISSETVYNNRKFVAAAVIINHVLSAINAGRTAVRHNAELDNAFGDLQIRASVMGDVFSPHGIELTFVRSF